MIELIADYIEEPKFDIEIGPVPSLDAFIGAIENLDICRLLALELQRPCNVQWLGARIKQLANEDIGPKYMHPRDTALTIYVHFLCKAHPEYIPVLNHALEYTPNLGYAIQLITRLACGREPKTS